MPPTVRISFGVRLFKSTVAVFVISLTIIGKTSSHTVVSAAQNRSYKSVPMCFL